MALMVQTAPCCQRPGWFIRQLRMRLPCTTLVFFHPQSSASVVHLRASGAGYYQPRCPLASTPCLTSCDTCVHATDSYCCHTQVLSHESVTGGRQKPAMRAALRRRAAPVKACTAPSLSLVMSCDLLCGPVSLYDIIVQYSYDDGRAIGALTPSAQLYIFRSNSNMGAFYCP